jgi:hypothetical protein
MSEMAQVSGRGKIFVQKLVQKNPEAGAPLQETI